MAARATTERFVIAHPFLYFVLDTDTNVALMAGKIVDPLNSRIYWWFHKNYLKLIKISTSCKTSAYIF